MVKTPEIHPLWIIKFNKTEGERSISFYTPKVSNPSYLISSEGQSAVHTLNLIEALLEEIKNNYLQLSGDKTSFNPEQSKQLNSYFKSLENLMLRYDDIIKKFFGKEGTP